MAVAINWIIYFFEFVDKKDCWGERGANEMNLLLK